ncbi:hypothetical protein NCLIV_033830 [Neospora caninum Liverpool]|uniref:Hsp70-binding protein 1 n=1 Tax=Neospora caninum (strain Liverpool) TaxID=572307 RepID=F0VIN5_NEOCL|nr:hypothetical protein NCLIV_033830 [Neospora caninum Liverpool]CBZ53596.1 hypothetical protein NCLIV_033830 [Neospora caninum Liverpool]CEL67586.1 TPA: Hsp70-binding protein 1 [Neospora caninum Liverpool]|eukprot:XP_003883628.1 hypothetical protein NCLIV_033830 [Neospora caninum Liverpool]
MARSGVNWPGLYRWSMEYHDGTVPRRMSKEDCDFLQNAIREAMNHQEDPAKVLTEQLAVIDGFNQGNPNIRPRNLVAALSVIERLIDDYSELARDFEKLGALQPCLRLLATCSTAAQAHETHHERPPVTSEEDDAALAATVVNTALTILSLIVANNPQIQEAVYKQQGLALLMNLVKEAPANSSLRVKALTALACEVRHHRQSELAFVNAGGLAILVHAMHSRDEKYQEKAASLTRHLLQEQLLGYAQVEKFDLPGAVGALLEHTPFTNIQFSETVVQLAIALLQQHRVAMAKAPVLAGLRQTLLDRQRHLVEMLREMEKRGNSDELLPDDFATQSSLLEEAISIAKFPGMKPSEAASTSGQNTRQGGVPTAHHAKMLGI